MHEDDGSAQESEIELWDAESWMVDVVETPTRERIAVIRTSDRAQFRGCRRRWGWNSHLRGNLGPIVLPAQLWLGSGFHFAMEDAHGYARFKHPVDAFNAYIVATKRGARGNPLRLPGDISELTELCRDMLRYYWDEWLKDREPLQTYWVDGVPQVEVNGRIELPWERGKYGYDRVFYSFTLDRVVVNQFNTLSALDYKTAAKMETMHLTMDDQVSSYLWAGSRLYDRPMDGMIYQQHWKTLPHTPKILANGRMSTDKRQTTTYGRFLDLMMQIYRRVDNAPSELRDVLNYYATLETPTTNKFIRRDFAWRNDTQREAQGVIILMELDEMLNPNTPLYPNPTRLCANWCPFLAACESVNDGSDWAQILRDLFEPRAPIYDTWRAYLPTPDELHAFDIDASVSMFDGSKLE